MRTRTSRGNDPSCWKNGYPEIPLHKHPALHQRPRYGFCDLLPVHAFTCECIETPRQETTIMTPEALSRELRSGSSRFLQLRRKTLGLSLLAAGAMAPISLYQMGIIRHLPEPPLPRLNADAIDAAPEAYEILATPDAVLGLVSFGVTAWLAAAGGEDRVQSKRWLPLALAGKVAIDAANGARLSIDQWTRHRAFCSWCLLAAGASFATVPLVIPEARAAIARAAS